MSVRLLKRALRREVSQVLKALSPDTVEAESSKVVQQLLALPVYQNSRSVSVYISMSGEVITNDIISDVFRSGKRCYVPRWEGDMMQMVRLRSMDDYLSLPINKWNIPEPNHDEEREDALDADGLDLIIMPGVAFDKVGNRLGHGKGYYDRYLMHCQEWAECNKASSPTTIAISLSSQMIEIGRIPCEDTDKKPDMIITPTQLLRKTVDYSDA